MAAADTRQSGAGRLDDRGHPVNTRHAADLVGATKMDRPEWIDTYPDELMAVATLTNNSSRGAACRTRRRRRQPTGEQRVRPHPSLGLRHRLHRPDVLVGHLRARRRPRRPGATDRRSTATSTDHPTGSTSPRAAGCGSRPTCRHRRSTAARTPASATTRCCAPTRRRAGRADSWSDPSKCEITGCFATPDETTLFVGIQHPGRSRAAARAIRPTRRRTARGRTATPGSATFGAARHHQGRRRRDRQLIQEAVRRFCSSK